MYQKPMMISNDELAENIYAATSCYTVDAQITQRPETGREYYVIQVNAKHAAADGHTSSHQSLTLTFNQEVTYGWSGGTLTSAATGTSITIEYWYWNNPNDNIGLADIVVTSAPGLAITGSSMSDDA